MKKTVIAMMCALLFLLGGCETMKGLGEDIETAGKAIKKKASE